MKKNNLFEKSKEKTEEIHLEKYIKEVYEKARTMKIEAIDWDKILKLNGRSK